jgi:putative peptidoglycan lipid II flippase
LTFSKIKNTFKFFKSHQAGTAALFVSVATLLSTVLGLVRDKVMAHYFGASLDTDFYNYGFTIPDALQNILIMGVTTSSFIPIYAEYVANKSREEAGRMASSFLNITLLAFTGICLFVGLFMPQITDLWLGSEIDAEQKSQVVLIARIFLLAQIAFAASKILSGILQTHKHFTAYALGLLVYNPSIILGMILFHKSSGIESMAYGALIGSGLVVLINVFDLKGTHFRFSPQLLWNNKGVKRIWILAIPNFLNMALLQGVFVIYSRLSVNLQEGSYSAFRYALNFESFPVSIFGISFVTAIFPFLAENASKNHFENFNYNIQNSYRQILYLTLPAGFGMAILSHDIVGLILGGGRFGEIEVNLTASVLFFYALTVPLESLWYLYARAYYALKDTWTPFWFRLAGTIINLLISYFLSPVLGVAAFSLGLLCAFSVQMVMFTIGLKMKIKEYDLKSVLMVSAKLMVCALIMTASVYAFKEWAYTSDFISGYSARMQYLFVVVTGIVLGFGVYVVLTMIFRCADFSVIRRVSGRIFK